MSNKVIDFPTSKPSKPSKSSKQATPYICIEHNSDQEDVDAAIFCLSASAIGLSAAANVSHKCIMNGALIVAAQAALSAGLTQEQFKYIASKIEFLDDHPLEKD